MYRSPPSTSNGVSAFERKAVFDPF